jgi:hypothetical protein
MHAFEVLPLCSCQTFLRSFQTIASDEDCNIDANLVMCLKSIELLWKSIFLHKYEMCNYIFNKIPLISVQNLTKSPR